MWFVDADSKEHGGADGLDAWFNHIDKDSTAVTRAHKTGTDGLHFIFREDPHRPMGCSKGKLWNDPCIAVKGDGGYVIFPPSSYERNGATVSYSVSHDLEPASAPTWLYDLILGARPRSKGNGEWTGNTTRFVWSEGWGQEKLAEVCELVRTATKGHWDEARRKVFMFGRWAGGGAVDVDEAWKELDAAANACHAPEDYPREVKRSYFNGIKEPLGPFIEVEEICLDDFYAYMPKHRYIYIPTRGTMAG
jgi:hypothetical protein